MSTRRIVLGALGDGAELPALARKLRDAGIEVVYTGPTTVEQLAVTVAQEDPDAVAVDERVADVTELLGERDAGDIPVLGAADVLAWADTPGDRTHHPR